MELAIILLTIVFILLCPFTIRALASMDVFFTFGVSNNIKYVERGGVLHRVIADVPNFTLAKDGRTLQPGKTQQSFLHRLLGIYFIGVYPFFKVRSFEIKKQSENILGNGPSDWIKYGETIKTTTLRFNFPRPYVFTNIELGDRTTVNLKIVMEFQVVDTYIPIYVYNGDFFKQAGSLLEGEVIDVLKKFTIDEFVLKEKGEINGILQYIKVSDGSFNQKLISLTGLKVLSVSINDYEPGDKELIEVIRQKALAREKGDALIETANKQKVAETIDAEKYATVTTIKTEADFYRGTKLAVVNGTEIKQVMDNLSTTGADTIEVVRTAGKVLQAKAVQESKLTTWVQGPAEPVVQVGGEK